jgi:hypothetical protein
MEKIQIRDPGWKNSDPGWEKFVSGIREKPPQHCASVVQQSLRGLLTTHNSQPAYLLGAEDAGAERGTDELGRHCRGPRQEDPAGASQGPQGEEGAQGRGRRRAARSGPGHEQVPQTEGQVNTHHSYTKNLVLPDVFHIYMNHVLHARFAVLSSCSAFIV